MTRVAIFCNGLDDHSIKRQPWLAVYEISKRMRQRGVATTLVSDGIGQRAEEIDGVPVIRGRMTALSSFYRNPIEAAMREINPDVIIWHEGLVGGAAKLSLLRRLKKPVIWIIDSDLFSIHDFCRISPREVFSLTHHFFWRQFVASIFPRFLIRTIANSGLIQKIIVPSVYIERTLTSIGVNPTKIEVVRPGMAEDVLARPITEMSSSTRDEVRRMLGCDSNDFLVCYFGSPCTLRGTDTLVRSLAQTASRLHRIRLLILSRGEPNEALHLSHGPEIIYLKNLAEKLGVSDRLKIIPGNLTKGTLWKYVQVSDVVALPFKILFSEPPLSLLEAMKLGKVVIATDVGTLPEIVGEGRGIVIQPNDSGELATVVSFLTEHPEDVSRLEKNAQAYASNFPTWDLVAARLASMCDELENRYVRGRIMMKLLKKVALKQEWQTLKKNLPLTTYRQLRKKLAYALFGVRNFNIRERTFPYDFGVDEFGRNVSDGLAFYIQLLEARGLDLSTVVALGSRAKRQFRPQSDVDVIVIARNLPESKRQVQRIISDTPVFMGLEPDGFTPEEFLEHLEDFDMQVLDAVYYGKVIYDNGFWLEVRRRFDQLDAKYGIKGMNLERGLQVL
jgi:glycosyltransferase involved in cell wall biosynthesis/predicted nucleotidyltransferase